MCLELSHRPALCPVPLFLLTVESGHLSSSPLFLTRLRRPEPWAGSWCCCSLLLSFVLRQGRFDKDFKQKSDTILNWWIAERVDTTALALLPTVEQLCSITLQQLKELKNYSLKI